jgi:hypothetical protein
MRHITLYVEYESITLFVDRNVVLRQWKENANFTLRSPEVLEAWNLAKSYSNCASFIFRGHLVRETLSVVS